MHAISSVSKTPRVTIYGSPQIPSESEGTAIPPISGPLRFQRNLRGRSFLRFRVSSDFFGIGGDGGSLRTPIFDRCPERTRKERSSGFPPTYRSEETLDLSFLESERKARCFSRVFSGHRSKIDARREPLFPPISSKSEENPFFSPSHEMAREKKLSHKWQSRTYKFKGAPGKKRGDH